MDIGNAAKVISILSDFSDALPLLLFLIVLPLARRPTWIIPYLAINLGFSISTIIIGRFGLNNMFVYLFMGLFELIFLYLFFVKYVNIQKILKVTFWVVLGFYLIQSFVINSWDQINPIGRATSSMFLLGLCFNYYFEVYKSNVQVNLLQSMTFWISSSLVLYLSGSFFAFLFSYEALFNEEYDWFFRYGTWTLYALSQLIKGLVLSVGVLIIALDSSQNSAEQKSFE